MNWLHPSNLGFAVRSKLADIGRGARLFARLMQLVGAAFARPGLVRDQVHFLGPVADLPQRQSMEMGEVESVMGLYLNVLLGAVKCRARRLF